MDLCYWHVLMHPILPRVSWYWYNKAVLSLMVICCTATKDFPPYSCVSVSRLGYSRGWKACWTKDSYDEIKWTCFFYLPIFNQSHFAFCISLCISLNVFCICRLRTLGTITLHVDYGALKCFFQCIGFLYAKLQI